MHSGPIHLGASELQPLAGEARGEFVVRDGECWYCIENAGRMAPFLMSLVSDSDHWMFVSSRGGLTAGRRNAESALFPYTTDDRVHDSSGRRGPMTVLLVQQGHKVSRWEPFRTEFEGVYDCSIRLYKNVAGDRLLFEKENRSLGLSFSYEWASSERFGFVRRVRLKHLGGQHEACSVRVLDGLLDILPSGVESGMQTGYSTLIDAYKRCEAEADGLTLYRLSSVPVDRPVPSEALAATSIWWHGLEGARRLLSTRQVEAFRNGLEVEQEDEVRGQRGAFLLQADLTLALDECREWAIVAEVDQDAADVSQLRQYLGSAADRSADLAQDILAGTRGLERLVGLADGLQRTGNPAEDARHFANAMFNIMRGGIFESGYKLPIDDLRANIHEVAPQVFRRHEAWLSELPAQLERSDLLQQSAERDDPDLQRLVDEYLPLSFSRRHGDPSRPWNAFSIEVRQHLQGGSRYAYAGNWRDIFQNWEALCASYPRFLHSVVTRFVDSSTADGYNPYRLTRSGFEWEVPDPGDPWAHIGYWGDHQIIYLLRLLDLWQRHDPRAIAEELGRERYVYADVPYRIGDYDSLLEDPRNTITFDKDHADYIDERVAQQGQEGRLLHDSSGELHRVCLAEKLVLPVLVKLSNLIPELGIWLNTQRPEWNDANNALVGRGASVVTLCHMRGALAMYAELFETNPQQRVSFSCEVAAFMRAIDDVFRSERAILDGPMSPSDRRRVLDGLGRAGGEYRGALYSSGMSGQKEELGCVEIAAMLRGAKAWVSHSIRANRRADGLFHAYNLLEFAPDGGVQVRRLPVMLEGQVAVLSADLLDGAEISTMLDALRASELFREDQHSYLLYPDRNLPRFIECNCLPVTARERAPVLSELVVAGERSIVIQGADGQLHFAAKLGNAAVLAEALDDVSLGVHSAGIDRDRASILDLYEETFDHAAFTGRSGTFYGYEGLGCIYWHQVSKLLLATHEALVTARNNSGPCEALERHYLDLRLGLGTAKSPAAYGAFPTDPYSHTPSFAGAQQPGMTGQVKEDVLARLGELGVLVSEGCLALGATGAGPLDWCPESTPFDFIDARGARRQLEVPKGALAFTLYQVPIVLHQGGQPGIEVLGTDGDLTHIVGHKLSPETSAALFDRSGSIARIDVWGR
ncbi:MAG: hypothetical protein ACI841_003794 [Planctomycetota bacterium]|jgi:hypothetical protein